MSQRGPGTSVPADFDVLLAHSSPRPRATDGVPDKVIVPIQVFVGDPAVKEVVKAVESGGDLGGLALDNLAHLIDACATLIAALLRGSGQLRVLAASRQPPDVARGERRATGPGSAPGPPGSRLTQRELEVAELIAEGLSNKQIAAELLISQRTAETHVEHILQKLGFASRVQVATWAANELAARHVVSRGSRYCRSRAARVADCSDLRCACSRV